MTNENENSTTPETAPAPVATVLPEINVTIDIGGVKQTFKTTAGTNLQDFLKANNVNSTGYSVRLNNRVTGKSTVLTADNSNISLVQNVAGG